MTPYDPRHRGPEAPRPEALEALLRDALRAADPTCPPLEVLAAADAPRPVAAHVAACPRCRAILAAASAPALPLPAGAWAEALLARARSVVAPPPGRAAGGRAGASSAAERAPVGPLAAAGLVIRALADRLVLVQGGGLLEAPVPLRGGPAEALVVRQPVGGVELEAHVRYGARAGFAILVSLGGEGVDPEDVRVTLRRDDRELVSERARGGHVMLPALGAGAYRLELSERGRLLGSVDLALEVA